MHGALNEGMGQNGNLFARVEFQEMTAIIRKDSSGPPAV